MSVEQVKTQPIQQPTPRTEREITNSQFSIICNINSIISFIMLLFLFSICRK